MSVNKKNKKPPRPRKRLPPFADRYSAATQAVVDQDSVAARGLFEDLLASAPDSHWRSQIESDLAVLAADTGDLAEARQRLARALELDPQNESARENLRLLEAEDAPVVKPSEPAQFARNQVSTPKKVAILSFLFNWPSTGGGIVHTLELAEQLGHAGYAVRHIYARNEQWGVGRVTETLPYDALALDFDEATWNADAIKARFRQAVDGFDPDYVIITDSWNMKPVLAQAVRDYPYLLRLQASECLCPLNNLRFLPDGRQCPLHQLATPQACRECVAANARFSGSLHHMERDLAGVGTVAYEICLKEAFQNAEAVLVVNELTAAMVSPHTRRTVVAPSGFDPKRFPAPDWPARAASTSGRKLQILMAGLVEDPTKGFHVLQAACQQLWSTRQDFELVVTADLASHPDNAQNPFTRWVGWQSQAALPNFMREADIVVVPTIAQDALGRTAVEGMAAGVPVVASRIGGLPLTLSDGAGLLFTAGDANELAETLALLLDDPQLRTTVGRLGRRRFERDFTWDAIIKKHYLPLLCRKRAERAAPTKIIRPVEVYQPFIPKQVNTSGIMRAAAEFLGLGIADADRACRDYRMLHDSEGYEHTLGELKTLCFEEACVLYLVLLATRPRTIVEIGTQYGKSTRRILDMKQRLGLACDVVCFDVANDVRHFRPDEARLLVQDVRGTFQRDVLEAFQPDLVFVDVHGYALLHEILEAALTSPQCPILAIHDCGRGLCNPRMTIAKDDPNVTSLTGTWERHVLAERFGISDPLAMDLDEAELPTHRLRILDTPHGLGIILPRMRESALLEAIA